MRARGRVTTSQPIVLQVNSGAPPPESRVVIEDGAYLFVDFLHPDVPKADRWPRLTVGRELIFDLTPTNEPILMELRRVIEAWEEAVDLRPPEATIAGAVRILTVGRRPYSLTVRTNQDQGFVHIRLGEPEPTVVSRVASNVLFEVAGLTREGPDTLRGHLAGIWVFGLPQVSAGILFRALRVVGPPIGLAVPEEGQERNEGALTIVARHWRA